LNFAPLNVPRLNPQAGNTNAENLRAVMVRLMDSASCGVIAGRQQRLRAAIWHGRKPSSSASTRHRYSHRHSMTEVSRPAHGALFLLLRLKANQLLLATILAITTTTTNSDEKIPMPTA
jgi:hypothetical protein